MLLAGQVQGHFASNSPHHHNVTDHGDLDHQLTLAVTGALVTIMFRGQELGI